MRKFFLLASLLSVQCVSVEPQLEKYFSYVELLGQPQGNYRAGEIEIVLDPMEIDRVQIVQQERLLKKGASLEEAREFSRIGVVYEDQYWVWMRDAVYFPQGVPGTYDRLIWKNEFRGDVPGVAILPILPSGKVVLNVNYRHATRSWELELPRGKLFSGETFEEAALRELKEETGLIASSVLFLGKLAPDSGVLSCIVPVYLGRVSARGESDPEYSEAISDVLAFTMEELDRGLVQGFLEVPLQGQKKEIPLRDPFLTFALLQAQLRHLF